ncbi:MAG: DUF3575 domain-containing protein [Alloprevotella sp.]
MKTPLTKRWHATLAALLFSVLSLSAQTDGATDDVRSFPEFAVRANLLRWATLTPSLGVECRLNERWSVLADAALTSWSSDSWKRRYALWEVMPEVRYHISPKFYVGLQGKVGSFNHKFSVTGKQGDLIGGGVSFGYRLPLSACFDLDFHAAVGMLHADYERYTVENRRRIFMGEDQKNWWGPTSLGITLSYRFKR